MSVVPRAAGLMAWCGLLLAQIAGAAYDVQVRSAAWSEDESASDFAEFFVNGMRLSASDAAGRGINIAVLQSDGTLRDFGCFDTHGAGSEALIAFVDGLHRDTVALFAIRDEAMGNLSADARRALERCGATKLDSVGYRGSWALVGVKDREALAEQASVAEAGPAEALAQSVSDSGEEDRSVEVLVRSSGWDSENLAEFFVEGVRLPLAPGRGMNVAVVAEGGVLEAFHTFDTHSDGSEDFVDFIDQLSEGSFVLVASRDEAKDNLTEEAQQVFEEALGAQRIQEVAYRSAYALVAVKGKGALAEAVLASDGGVAEVSARYSFAANEVSMIVECQTYEEGNSARFWVNGSELDGVAAPSRGLSLAVLDEWGGLVSFGSFDTHAVGSEPFAAAVAALPFGATVMVGTLDEAQSNLSADARWALRSLGAARVSELVYRGAYALVGVKGGRALAEQVIPAGAVKVSATRAIDASVYAGPTTTSTTTTTTTLEPACRFALCPPGSTINPERADELSADEDYCCHEAASDTAVDVGVQSAGFDDGNQAIFFSGGKVIFSTSLRGLTVLVLRDDATRLQAKSFDTFEDGSAALEEFLDSLSPGTMILVGASDEPSRNLTAGAKRALRDCGATMLDIIGFRSSYALVGVKGGEALAEMVLPTLGGKAVAVTQMQPNEHIEPDRPVCDARVPEPPVKGYASSGNLILDAGCRYRLWERPSASSCLKNTWITIFGSSNTLLEFGNLVNLLAPDEYDIDRPGELVGASAMVDVVIKDGKVVHWETVSNNLPACRQVDKADAAALAPECRAAMESVLMSPPLAPAYDPEAIRITMFLSFFWDRMELALDVLESDAAWKGAEMALVVQIGAWYNVCAVTKESYCPRKELLEVDRDTAIGIFKDDMEESLQKLDTLCAPGGRAGALGCNIQTISWTNSVKDSENFKVMNGYIRDAMAPRWSETLRLVDFFSLGGGMPEEVVMGHGSQMLNLWVWQVMLGAMCPASLASAGSYAEWHGNLCSGTEAIFENCPNYYPKCESGVRCEKWECMNSEPCTFEAIAPPTVALDMSDACEAPVALEPQTPAAGAADTAPEPCHSSRGRRNRLWCQDSAEWPLVVALVATACGVLGAMRLRGAMAARRKAAAAEAEGAAAVAAACEAAPAPTLLISSPAGSPKGRADKTDPGADHPAKADSVASAYDSESDKADRSECVGIVVEPSPVADRNVVDGDDKLDEALPSKVAAADAADSVADEGDGAAQPDDRSCVSRGAPMSAAVGTAKGSEKDGDSQKEVAGSLVSRWSRLLQILLAPALPLLDRLPAPPVAGHRYPLGFARFCASMHVVVGHLYAKGDVVTPEFFFGWGFTWVPWFFMLSGFVLFSAHLKNPKQERMFQYVMRRSVTIYPLYAFSVIVAFAMQKGLGTMQASTVVLLAQSFLVQAWWPGWTDTALQMHCWFLSCMVVYWFFFKPLAWCFKDLTLLRTCALMASLFALPWLSIFVPLLLGASPDWYASRAAKTDQALQFAIVTLKFHPVCYAHVFMLGMLLAKLRTHLDRLASASGLAQASWANPWRWAMQFVAPLGYFGLLLVFSDSGFQPQVWGYKLSARLSVLLPFQAMVLLGLAGLPRMPLPGLAFAFSKLDFLERYSYCVYVFQFIAYGLWPKADHINLPGFLLFLAAFAVVVANCVQQPIQRWWSSHPRGRLAVPFIMAAVLGGLSFLPDPEEDISLSPIPAFRRLDDQTIDVRLTLMDTGAGAAGDSVLINPSLLVREDVGDVVVAARRHSLETKRYVGEFTGRSVSIQEHLWHSDIVIGSAPLDAEAWAAWPEDEGSPQPFTAEVQTWSGLRTASGGDWTELCVEEIFIPENNTLIRIVVSGPEDPKVFPTSQGVGVTFCSKPPSSGEVSCRTGKDGMLDAVSQMYLSTDVPIEDLSRPTVAHHLTYGKSSDDEKNWIPFDKEGNIFFVYNPQPHVIVAAQANGTSEKVHSPSFRPLMDLLKPGLEARGSGQAVLIDDPESTPNLPSKHYLALMHLVEEKTGVYSHFAYRFHSEPPFPILQISSQLPLTEAEATPGGVPFAFASGLAIMNRTVAISYGAGDRDARALVMTLERLDQMFDCRADQTPA